MLHNYLLTAFRNFWRNKAYSFINISGLTVGLACSFFILLWVQDEFRYNQLLPEGEHIYRGMRHASYGEGQTYTFAALPYPLAEVLQNDYPEVADVAVTTWDHNLLFRQGNQTFREPGLFGSKRFFTTFGFPMLKGDPETALANPTSVVLSASLAEKYFGPDGINQAIGQTIFIDDRLDFTVTGVFADLPAQSTLQFDFVLPIEDFTSRNSWVEEWGNNGLNIYTRLHEGTPATAFNAKAGGVIMDRLENSNPETFFLQPFTDIYLHSTFEAGELVGGRIEYVRIFIIVAVFILLIASINFMNLSTARSAKRAREIGVRKAVGATQQRLVAQFIGESVLLAVFALSLALLLVVAGLGAFNEITDKHIALATVFGPMGLLFVGIALLTGLLAGSYPAFYLASFNIIRVLRGTFQHRRGTIGLRKGMVVFQFALSILLIIGTLTVYQQLNFIRTKNLGMEREHVVYLRTEGPMAEQYHTARAQLLDDPSITHVSLTSQHPTRVGQSTGGVQWEGKTEDDNTLFHLMHVDFDFIELMNMQLAQGRTFAVDFATDSTNYVINERAAKAMGMGENPVGQALSVWGNPGTIIGMVRDFHMTTMYDDIEPLVFRLDPSLSTWLYLRTAPGQTQEALAHLEAVHQQFNAGYPFNYTFLDETYERTYRSEQMVGTLSNYFALLAVFIACLGLFGLASFTAEQRTKEVGIRKVLGASISNLVVLLSRDFIVLVAVAFCLAAPIAHYFTGQWLSSFAYHISTGWVLYVGAGMGALAIAWMTVGYQAFKAAVRNPVKALRTE